MAGGNWEMRHAALIAIVVAMLAFGGVDMQPVEASAGDGGRQFFVQPYYVYPHDQPYHVEYAQAIDGLSSEIRHWYADRVGRHFRFAQLKVVRSPDDYLVMRCGPQPDASCRDDRQAIPFMLGSVLRAIGGLPSRQSTWIFAQGAGGFAGANLFGDYVGFAMLGDWVLEPISGVAEPAGIPCIFATWQCQGGVPKGAAAHELGHTFGLHHPPAEFPGQSLMRWHGDYPDTELLAHEVMILRESPLFVGPSAFDERGPWLDFENADFLAWGQVATLSGHSFSPGDALELRDARHSIFLTPDFLTPFSITFLVPEGLDPGYARVWHGRLQSNAVPINFVPTL